MAFIPTHACPLLKFAVSKPTTNSAPRIYASALSRRSALQIFTVSALLLPDTASADHTYIAARRSFDRYHPRILSLLLSMRDIRAAVISHDAAKVRDIVDSKIFDIKGRRAMSIYATSFSDNYLSERSRGLIKCVEGFFKEVRLVAEGVDMSDHYEKAVHFLNVYYRGARLPMEELDGLQL